MRTLSEIPSKTSTLGENIEEAKLVKKFLKNFLRKKYIHKVASLEQILDLKITSFEDIIGRLKIYEERICEEEETQENQNNKMMYEIWKLLKLPKVVDTMGSTEKADVGVVEDNITIVVEDVVETLTGTKTCLE